MGKAVALLLAVAAVLSTEVSPAAAATVHKVGDDKGWTLKVKVDYSQWSADQFFAVGDTVVFEYNTNFHDVMQVTHLQFRACNASAPIATYKSGNDSIKIKTPGHHFFLCSTPGHCQAGQKVDINVESHDSNSSTAPVPSPSSPSTSNHVAPSASPSSHPGGAAPQSLVTLLLAALALFVSGFA